MGVCGSVEGSQVSSIYGGSRISKLGPEGENGDYPSYPKQPATMAKSNGHLTTIMGTNPIGDGNRLVESQTGTVISRLPGPNQNDPNPAVAGSENPQTQKNSLETQFEKRKEWSLLNQQAPDNLASPEASHPIPPKNPYMTEEDES